MFVSYGPHFAASHFQIAAASPRLLFIDYHDSETLSIDFHAWLDDDSAFSPRPEFLHPQTRPEFVEGFCF